MSSFWQYWFGTQSPQAPRSREASLDRSPPPPPRPQATAQSDQVGRGYPNSFRAAAAGGIGADRPQIFDPALLHYPRAFRQGDPKFDDPAVGRQWYEARRHVIAHLLRAVGGSHWRDHLVLRASLLLQAWLGEASREPGDIDWIFRSESVGPNDAVAQGMLDELRTALADDPMAGPAIIEVDKITLDDIWAYERAAGKRIRFPWLAENLPHGDVQMDITFREKLLDEPQETAIATIDGGTLSLLAAGKAMSLAWKLHWLETDMHPQGKDLYDATLLAEQTRLPYALLIRTLQAGDWRKPADFGHDFPLQWRVDWDNFLLECPWIEGSARQWQARLAVALAPTFADVGC